MARLFVLDFVYVDDLSLVDAQFDAHRDYLRRHYAEGRFLASGRKDPRTGGVIIARGTREEIERVVAEDPFTTHFVAQVRISEFLPTMTCDELAALREPLTTP